LSAALVLGKRQGYGTRAMAPHNLVLTPDRRLAAVGRLVRLQRELGGGGRRPCAGMATATTQIATAAAALAWMIAEWTSARRPSVSSAWPPAPWPGLVAITPASGFRRPGRRADRSASSPAWSAISSAVWLKKMLGYDDSLDAFGRPRRRRR
jgi:Amt family ammonium transporter